MKRALLAVVFSAMLPASTQAATFTRPIPDDYTMHWWRSFREPSYCKMVLCNGSCAWTGSAPHSGCSLTPMYPILQTADCCKDAGCGP